MCLQRFDFTLSIKPQPWNPQPHTYLNLIPVFHLSYFPLHVCSDMCSSKELIYFQLQRLVLAINVRPRSIHFFLSLHWFLCQTFSKYLKDAVLSMRSFAATNMCHLPFTDLELIKKLRLIPLPPPPLPSPLTSMCPLSWNVEMMLTSVVGIGCLCCSLTCS